ncbi:MAG: universal stress protein, partial [Candidatus Thermoplasmatota archaeon]
MTANVHYDDLHDRFIREINQAIDLLTFGNNEAPRTGAEAKHNQPRYRNIVVAYDGRPGSEHALEWAKDIAAAHGAKVTVASVFARPGLADATSMGFAWYPEYAQTYALLESNTRKLADDAVEGLREANIE